MAKIGLKHIVAAPLNEDGTTYGTGYVVAKAIKATVNSNNNDVKLYADDGMAESDKSFKDGSISLNVDDLNQKTYADMMGHTYTAADAEKGTPETVTAAAQDIAPFLGVGFYGAVKRSNRAFYVAKWLKKVQFAEPNDETETKGETVNFQTPTIEGTVFQADDGTWKEQAEFPTEAEALAWVDAKANIAQQEKAMMARKRSETK